MTQFTFAPAVRHKSRARVALVGPSGSGKTYTALLMAAGLADGGRIAVIDTEHGSASKYAGAAGIPPFDVLELKDFGPNNYVQAIAAAERAGYAVVVIDSLSHAWNGEGGALELVDRAAKQSRAGNSYTAWRDVTPMHTALINKMVGSSIHVIATMRAKTAYVQEKDANGKTVIRKVGLEAVQRDGMEYEFDVVGDITVEHELVVTKTRCPFLDGAVVRRPDAALGATILGWLQEGLEAPPAPEPTPSAPKAPPTPAPALGEPGRLLTVVDGQGVPHTIVDDGSIGAAMAAIDTERETTPHWTPLIDAAAYGKSPLSDLRKLYNRIGQEEEDLYHRTGARAKAAIAFMDLILAGKLGDAPAPDIVKSVLATVVAMGAEAAPDSPAPWGRGELRSNLLQTTSAARAALNEMLKPATAPREEI